MSDLTYDVVAVDMDTLKVRLIAEGKSGKNAYAIEEMAAIRRGTENEFFSVVDAGEYKEGDRWQ